MSADSHELRRDVAFVANVLAHAISFLADQHGRVHRLTHRATQALRAVDRLRAEVDEHELERSGAS